MLPALARFLKKKIIEKWVERCETKRIKETKEGLRRWWWSRVGESVGNERPMWAELAKAR